MTYLAQSLDRLRRDKSVSALIVLVLGSTLGAALCAGLFTDLMLRSPLPYPQQDRLMLAEQVAADPSSDLNTRQFSYPAIALLHAAKDVFAASVMLDRARDMVTSLSSQPLIAVTYASPDYPSVFAPEMAKGRFFAQTDANAGATAVLSYSAWQMLYAQREDVIGQVLRTASGTAFEIVGVTAANFVEPQFYGPGHRTDVWLPWRSNPSPAHAGWGWQALTNTLVLAGRLQPELTPEQAGARLLTILRTQSPQGVQAGARQIRRVDLSPARSVIAANGATVGPLLLASTLGLVLIAVVNVMHLLIARLLERRRDLMIRRALGASTGRLFGLLFAENLWLMLATAVVALGSAALGITMMQRFLGDVLPRVQELSLGAAALGCTMLTALLLAGALAAIPLAASDRLLAASDLGLGRPGVGAKITGRWRITLMAGQIAIAALLVFSSFGLLREATRVIADSDMLVLANTYSAFLFTRQDSKNPAGDERQLDQIKRSLQALPEVETVSQSHSPLQDYVPAVIHSARDNAGYAVGLKRIDSRYLPLVGQTVIRGDNFLETDHADSADVAIVNATFAEKLSAQGEVLGAQLMRGNTRYLVVGVVADLAYPGMATGPRIFLPTAKAGTNLLIRFRPGARLTRQALVTFLATVSPDYGVFLYDDLAQQRERLMLAQRLIATTAAFISLLVALLAGIGLYGMIRYATQLRCAEIGVRRAFGAKDRDVLLLLWRMQRRALAVGLACSAALGLLLLNGPWVAGLSAYLPASLWAETIAAVATLALLSLGACYLSARPVLAQSPAVALGQNG